MRRVTGTVRALQASAGARGNRAATGDHATRLAQTPQGPASETERAGVLVRQLPQSAS